VPEGPERPPSGGTRLRTVAQPERGIALRVARRGVADGGSLCVGRTLAEEAELAQIFQGILLAAMLGMLVSGGTMGWLLVRRAMSGVERVTQTAVHIGRDRLGERVDVGREGQEIEDLAVAFNEMLERIDTLVKNLREVTDNLAHDLRSPLTRLRGLAETTVISESRLDEYKELAATVVEEADALIALLNTVLEIAETDSGMARISSGAVNVGRLVRETRELFQPAAEDCGIRLECDPAPEDLVIQGDVARLQRVMANLLDNAIKNTPSGGTIRLSASGTPGRAAIVVEDTGTGIDVKDLPRIFDRFYRGDRSRTQPGSGLGLSLSLAIVRAHGGEIRVESAPGKGSVFTVLLPRPAP
jgi:signal transduction histidine kinase